MLSILSLMVPAPTDSAADAALQAAAPEVASLREAVSGVVSCILGSPRSDPDVEDCTHEVLRRALEGSRSRRGEALRPWVLGIARHVALDCVRGRRRARRHDGDDGAVDAVADTAAPVDDALSRQQEHLRARDAIRSLPEGQRRALELFHAEGLGYQQIAERLGVRLGTVATWISRGRQTVAAALNKEDVR